MSEKRSPKQNLQKKAKIPLNNFKKDKNFGSVYLFELNKRHDIDGYVPYNTARFMNHSCSPNCEPDIIRGHIWITALQNIKKGNELTYNYGYDFENFEDHVCICGAQNCVGYILSDELWPKLKKLIKNNGKPKLPVQKNKLLLITMTHNLKL